MEFDGYPSTNIPTLLMYQVVVMHFDISKRLGLPSIIDQARTYPKKHQDLNAMISDLEQKRRRAMDADKMSPVRIEYAVTCDLLTRNRTPKRIKRVP